MRALYHCQQRPSTGTYYVDSSSETTVPSEAGTGCPQAVLQTAGLVDTYLTQSCYSGPIALEGSGPG